MSKIFGPLPAGLFLVIFFIFASVPCKAFDRFNTLIWNSEDRGSWYEWWYFKVVVPGTSEAFFFSYGVVNPWDSEQTKKGSQSYIKAGSFKDGKVVGQLFTVKDFQVRSDSTFVNIGGNIATDRWIKGQLFTQGGDDVSWDLTLEPVWSFNAMGWVMLKDVARIAWYPAQASALMSGVIRFNGRSVTLSSAPAYQDRNWGRYFPSWWIWLVSNHFENSPGTVLAAGGGRGRVIKKVSHEAFFIGLHHQGHEYTFRPTDGDQVNVSIRRGTWRASARNHHHERIVISASAARKKFLLLPLTTPRGMTFNDFETLKGRIHVKLYKNSRLLASLQTNEGGIEFGSRRKRDFRRLLSGKMNLR